VPEIYEASRGGTSHNAVSKCFVPALSEIYNRGVFVGFCMFLPFSLMTSDSSTIKEIVCTCKERQDAREPQAPRL
jgi:hypothetical protein